MALRSRQSTTSASCLNEVWGGLPMLNASAREKLYKEIYSDRICMLSDLAKPPACELFPELADKIFQAYLFYTTFSVKVWLNYDSVADGFYNSARADQCGKLRLPKPQRKHVRALLTGDARLNRVNFELCTPMNSCTNLEINTTRTRLEDRFKWKSKLHGLLKSNLVDHLLAARKRLLATEGRSSCLGLDINQLDVLASKFRARPELLRYPSFGYALDFVEQEMIYSEPWVDEQRPGHKPATDDQWSWEQT